MFRSLFYPVDTIHYSSQPNILSCTNVENILQGPQFKSVTLSCGSPLELLVARFLLPCILYQSQLQSLSPRSKTQRYRDSQYKHQNTPTVLPLLRIYRLKGIPSSPNHQSTEYHVIFEPDFPSNFFANYLEVLI